MIHMIEFRAMNCQVSVQLDAGENAAAALRGLPDRLAAIEAALTRFNPDSELMRLNAHSGEWVTVSEVLFANIRAARQASLMTDGLYNPLILPALTASGYDRTFEQVGGSATHAPLASADWRAIKQRPDTREVYLPAGSALDLGGIAKGWAATAVADDLFEFGACLVNIGGDMVARGAPEGFSGWPVEIQDPLTGEPFTTVYLLDQSISTSGIDFRHWQDDHGRERHHIIDPRTGDTAVTDVLSATVIHPHAPTAEAYAKALILRGADEGLEWLHQQWYASGLVFRRSGTVLATSTLIHERNA